MKTTFIEGIYHNFGTSCQEFVALNYDPFKDEILVQTPDLTIYKSGVTRGWDRAYSDQLSNASFAYKALPESKYPGTLFGGYGMTKELLQLLKEKYPSHVEATYVDLYDYHRYHQSFLDWCKEHAINVLGWFYGEYQIEKCPDLNSIPFYLKGDTLVIHYEDQDGFADAVRMSPIFIGDEKWWLRKQLQDLGDTKYHVKVMIEGKNVLLDEYDLEV